MVSFHAHGPLGLAAAVSACADQQFGTDFHRIWEAQTLGKSWNVGLGTGYLSVYTAGGASDIVLIDLSRNWTTKSYKKLISRWDSERELSLRRHCTRTKNTIDTCINSATYRFLQRTFTNLSEITQCNGHYAVQGHSRSPILVPIESSYTTSY